MNRLGLFITGTLFFGLLAVSASAANFSSLYAFGDGVCTTTNNSSPSTNLYYGKRFTNGRVWIEVVAQWQGITYESNKNWSYFGHYSSNLAVNVNNFTAPTNANTALFIVWVNDADFVDFMERLYNNASTKTNLTAWTTNINRSITNHWKATTNLYAKGVRTLIAPNAVDITKIPQYSGVSAAEKTFIRQRVIDFNAGFTNMLNLAMTSSPGLTVYIPDMFTLLDNIIASPASYGLTNAILNVLENPAMSPYVLNGAGTNYAFWGPTDPTARVHMYMADVAQQLLSKAKVASITPHVGSNELELANVPVGRNGLVEGSTNFTSWSTVQSFSSTNVTQPVFVPASSDAIKFYRLRFPFVWTWP